MSDCDIFVSYAHEDYDRIKRLVWALEAEGWSVFWDRTLPPGESWRTYIGTRLRSAPVVIVAWSAESIESEWVAQEAEHAANRRSLVPVLIDKVLPPLGLGHIQSADLTLWLTQDEARLPLILHRAIASRLGKPGVAAPPAAAPPAPAPPARVPPAAAQPAMSAPADAPIDPAVAAPNARRGFGKAGIAALLALVTGGAALAWIGYGHYAATPPVNSAASTPKPAPVAAPVPAPAPPKNCSFADAPVMHGAAVTAWRSASPPHGTPCASERRECKDGVLSGSFGFAACTVAASPPPPPAPPQPKTCRIGTTTIGHGGAITAFRASSVPYNSVCQSERRECKDGVLSGSYGFTTCSVAAAPPPPPPPPKDCPMGGTVIAHGATVTAYRSSSVPYGGACEPERRECKDGVLSGSFGFTVCSVAAPPPPKNCQTGATSVAHGRSITAYRSSSVPFGAQCESERRECKDGVLGGSFGFTACTVASPPKNCAMGPTVIAHGATITAYRNSSAAHGAGCEAERRECRDGDLSGSYGFTSCTVAAPPEPRLVAPPRGHITSTRFEIDLAGSWIAARASSQHGMRIAITNKTQNRITPRSMVLQFRKGDSELARRTYSLNPGSFAPGERGFALVTDKLPDGTTDIVVWSVE